MVGAEPDLLAAPVAVRPRVDTEWVAVRGHWTGTEVKVLRNSNPRSLHVLSVRLSGGAHPTRVDRPWNLQYERFWPYYEPKRGSLEDNTEPWPCEPEACVPLSQPEPCMPPLDTDASNGVVVALAHAPTELATLAVAPGDRLWRVRFRRWVESEEVVSARSLLDVAASMDDKFPGCDVIGAEVAE